MGITERKDREKREIRKLVLDSAMHLFLEEGYKNVTIRKIAEQIEYSPATIYLYFKDKDEILSTLRKMAFEKFYEFQVSGDVIEDPVDRLYAQGSGYFKFAIENPGYYELMFFMKEPQGKIYNPEDFVAEKDSYEILKKNVKACIEAGRMRADNVDVTSFALWSYVHGIASLVIKRGFLMPKETLDYLVKEAFVILKNTFFVEK